MLLPCPCCGEPDASISAELADPGTLYCGECETTFTVEHVERLIRQWAVLLPWIKAMPAAAVDAAAEDPAAVAATA